ncbi:mevalonate kinase [Enterococcus sp. HY326]|uniref:mevalonate kinase n=1 Tax=Enterococcus sp. HY326 TaxID=2971265 RepID=UPI00223EDDBA|nr:mevalonate kinase [Enterococcus sp. HY326]
MEAVGLGKATGKIILMGEHSVVYGEPAIAMPFLATHIQTRITDGPENSLDSIYFSGKLADVPAPLKNIQALITALQEKFQQQAGIHLEITSTIPAERGMGSSAATAVAITRGYFDYQKTDLSDQELLDFVNLSEKIAHGNPSGIDAAATSGPNPLYFIKGQELSSFPMNVDAYLVVADTGIKGKTRGAVADVAKQYQENPAVPELIHILGQLAKDAKQAIISNQPALLGSMMTKAHRNLKALGVSNDALDLLTDTAIANNALGAKLTGGGRGGCLIALAEDLATAKQIAAAQEKAGAKQTWIQGLGVYQK